MGANGVGNIYILRVTVQLTCFEKSGASVAPLSSLLFTLFKKFAELCSLFFKFLFFFHEHLKPETRMRINDLQLIVACLSCAVIALLCPTVYAWIGPAACLLLIVCCSDVHRPVFKSTYGYSKPIKPPDI